MKDDLTSVKDPYLDVPMRPSPTTTKATLFVTREGEGHRTSGENFGGL